MVGGCGSPHQPVGSETKNLQEAKTQVVEAAKDPDLQLTAASVPR